MPYSYPLRFPAHGILMIIPRVCFSFHAGGSLETWLCFILSGPQLRVWHRTASWCGFGEWAEKSLLIEPKAGLGNMSLRWSSLVFSSQGHLKQFHYLKKNKKKRKKDLPKEIQPVDKFFHFLIFSKLKKKKKFHFLPFTFHLIGKCQLRSVMDYFEQQSRLWFKGSVEKISSPRWLTWPQASVNMSSGFLICSHML